MSEIRKHTVRVASLPGALKLVRFMLEDSKWLEVTPLPDDEWDIAVKAEEAAHIEKTAAAFKINLISRA